MSLHNLSLKSLLGVSLAVCCSALATVLFMEHSWGLEPCPLCILQRMGYLAVGLLALLGLLVHRRKVFSRCLLIAQFIAGLSGLAVAARHVYLEHLPADEKPLCGPSLDYMLAQLPLQDVLSWALKGSGDCANVSWTFLGLSLPSYALLGFVLLLVLTVMQWRKT